MPAPAVGAAVTGGEAGSASVTVAGAPTSAQDRVRMIAISAYLRAERRGFVGGSAEQDWLEAEAEIDRLLAQGTAVPDAK